MAKSNKANGLLKYKLSHEGSLRYSVSHVTIFILFLFMYVVGTEICNSSCPLSFISCYPQNFSVCTLLMDCKLNLLHVHHIEKCLKIKFQILMWSIFYINMSIFMTVSLFFHTTLSELSAQLDQCK
jgi:hypothetical protein